MSHAPVTFTLKIVLFTAIAGLSSCLLSAPTQPANQSADPQTKAPPPDPFETVRGITISCHGSGRAWGSDAMVETIRELKALGVNWIAIHPYASIRGNGRVSARYALNRDDGLAVAPQWLERPIREAHALGMKIMIKPHLAYWGSIFSWRGDITFQTDEEWDRFFTSYETWITSLAEMCADADAFVVGTELDQTLSYEENWRQIIASIRDEFKGPLTYAANWDHYQDVPFWDALDVIGIQAYFPLTPAPLPDAEPMDEDWPTVEQLDASWVRIMKELSEYSAQQGKLINFTELGYNQSSNAPYEPWSSRSGGPQAQAIQTRCLDRALAAIINEPTVNGPFLWKWFPGSSQRGSFAQARPHTRAVIAQHWDPTN